MTDPSYGPDGPRPAAGADAWAVTAVAGTG